MEQQIKEFDVIELIDGRVVTVLDVFGESKGYECEDNKAIEDGKELNDVLIDVPCDQVKQLVWTAPKGNRGEMMDIRQFDAVELDDGRRVVVLDIYDNPSGYEVEDVSATSSEGYDGDPSFSVGPCQIKRVLERAKVT
jgi:hypothetical protein